mgnify:CR=1 FL=1
MSKATPTSVSPDSQALLYKDWFTKSCRKESVRTKLPPSRYTEFLDLVDKHRGSLTKAAKEYGVHIVTVRDIIKVEPMFGYAVSAIADYHKKKQLEELEDVSFRNAQIDKNFTERAFQLKALAPEKYRERGGSSQTQVNVMVSGTAIKDRAKIIEDREKKVGK